MAIYWSTIFEQTTDNSLEAQSHGSCKRPRGFLGPEWGWESERATRQAREACEEPVVGAAAGRGGRRAHGL